MAMLACPHCGGPGISRARKGWLGYAAVATCHTCGKRITVDPVRATVANLPFLFGIVATTVFHTWPPRIVVLAIGWGLSAYLYAKHVPLVPGRDPFAWERVNRFRRAVFAPVWLSFLMAVTAVVATTDVMPLWLLLVLVTPLVAIGGLFDIEGWPFDLTKGFVDLLHSAGNIPPPPTYPNQDVLIARGQYAEAAQYFRDNLRLAPEDVEARLRLADLLERHLQDAAGAEQLYLEVRQLKTAEARQQFVAANGLIDLFRRTGRRDRLKVELARFAARYRGSRAREEQRGLWRGGGFPRLSPGNRPPPPAQGGKPHTHAARDV